MNPSDVEALFMEQLGMRLGHEMTDYLSRRFVEGGAAAVPIAYVAGEESAPAPVRRLAALSDVLGEGVAIPAEGSEPIVH